MDRASLIRVLAQLGGPTAPTTLEKPSGPVDIAFFYGTLMHPDIIRKVIGNDGSHLRAAPAILQVSRHSNFGSSREKLSHPRRNRAGLAYA